MSAEKEIEKIISRVNSLREARTTIASEQSYVAFCNLSRDRIRLHDAMLSMTELAGAVRDSALRKVDHLIEVEELKISAMAKAAGIEVAA